MPNPFTDKPKISTKSSWGKSSRLRRQFEQLGWTVRVDGEILRARRHAITPKTATDYNITPKPVTTAPVEELTRGNKDGIFTPLPGTAIEGKQVAASLQVPVYTEVQAVKSLLSRCKSPRLVHIATHGYFLAVEQPKLENFAFKNLQQAALVNPLTRSGLAFG